MSFGYDYSKKPQIRCLDCVPLTDSYQALSLRLPSRSLTCLLSDVAARGFETDRTRSRAVNSGRVFGRQLDRGDGGCWKRPRGEALRLRDVRFPSRVEVHTLPDHDIHKFGPTPERPLPIVDMSVPAWHGLWGSGGEMKNGLGMHEGKK
jgi:hypothetical protein